MTVTYRRAQFPPRHHAPSAGPAPGLALDISRRSLSVDGRPVRLTKREFELLAHLMAHPRLVFTRRQLLSAVWEQADVGDGRTVDVHVARVRTKLGAPYRSALATVRGVGYMYAPGAVAARP